MDRCRILVVEDEDTIAHILQSVLEDHECEVHIARTAEDGLAQVKRMSFDVALLDIVLPGMNGLQLLTKIREERPDTEVLMMTSHASVETVVEAIHHGAYDYIRKPFQDIEEVWINVQRAIEKKRLTEANRSLIVNQERQNQELGASVKRLSSLIEAGRAMSEFTSLSKLLDFFTGLVAKELDVERASLMLLDDAGEELRIAAARGLGGLELEKIRVKVGEGVAGRVARTGQHILVTDASSDARARKSANPKLSDSFISAPIVLSMPIKSAEKVSGVINVTNRISGVPFDEEDVAYLAGLAGQLAVAVERARHFDDLQRAYESLKAAQEQLVFAERLKAIGQMAAGVAHDFNNSLSVILGRAQLVIRRIDHEPSNLADIRGDLEAIEKISLQGAETVKRVQEYTRIRKDLPHSKVDLNVVVREAVEMTRPKWSEASKAQGRRIEIQLELNEMPYVSGNLYELTQIVGNLIFNSVEAMPNGGAIQFRTYFEEDTVCLEVRDSGVGMDEETTSRLFEPFYTTKETGQGLGTSIIYGIVSRHLGEVVVDSAPEDGTRVTIKLPRLLGHEPTASAADVTEAEETKANTILLVDDEDMVRETYGTALALSGHKVATAASGNEALEALAKGSFDLMITDLSMEGMSGLELSERVRKTNSVMPIILLSGWAIQQDEAQVTEAGINRVLAKPCPIERLLAAVGDIGTSPVAT
jgi:DNA-binding response OmpR family regulator/nitrogen-specific signal transduction histidine kinase